MRISKSYKIKFNGIEDELLVVYPSSDLDKEIFFKFRYKIYFKKGYIDYNIYNLDVDNYDRKEKEVFHIGIKSKKQNRIIGYVRIITTSPLPIIKDCFDFDEPVAIKLFSKGKLLEISRLIVDRYSSDIFLPRHLIMFLLIKEILYFSRNKKIYFGYAFIKKSLLLKFKKIFFPFFSISNYKQKYAKGVLSKYFNQSDNPVVPVYFNYFVVNMYIILMSLKFNKHICR